MTYSIKTCNEILHSPKILLTKKDVEHRGFSLSNQRWLCYACPKPPEGRISLGTVKSKVPSKFQPCRERHASADPITGRPNPQKEHLHPRFKLCTSLKWWFFFFSKVQLHMSGVFTNKPIWCINQFLNRPRLDPQNLLWVISAKKDSDATENLSTSISTSHKMIQNESKRIKTTIFQRISTNPRPRCCARRHQGAQKGRRTGLHRGGQNLWASLGL